jgi:hypothetical protein
MTRKTLALAAMVAGLLGILFTGLNGPGSGSATHLGLGAHASDPQVALYDNLVCRGSVSTLTGTEDATTFPSIGPCAGETLTTGTSVGQFQDTVIHEGNRLSLGANWSDSDFGALADGAVAEGTLIGTVLSAINIGCDDTPDYFVDNTSVLPLDQGFNDAGTVGEQFFERTTAWNSTSGPNGQSELFLDDIMPPPSYYPKHVRYRADVNYVTIGDGFPNPLVVPVTLNSVSLSTTFGDGRISITTLGGNPSAPSAQLVLCLDSPQTSTVNLSSGESGGACGNALDEDADGFTNDGCPSAGSFRETLVGGCANAADEADEDPGAPVTDDDGIINDGCPARGPSAGGLTNPGTPGLYAAWTVYLSAAGIIDEQEGAAGYVTNCKQIGGAFTDGDNDCIEDSLELIADCDPGAPVVPQASDRDCDNDGLIDGVDLTYLGSAACPNGGGSPVNTADCDGDGKTDAEEMLQTSQALTNPRAVDSDGDGFLDSGLNLDCNGNGAPDIIATETSAGAGSGRYRVMFSQMYCKPDGSSTNSAGLGGRPIGNPPPPASGAPEAGPDCNDVVDDDTDGLVNDGCGATPGAAQEDNCPAKANPGQENSSIVDPESNSNPADGTNGRFGGTPGDTSHFDAKFTGDECDGDDDNDGVPDEVEAATAEQGAACATGTSADDDGDGRVNDGCPASGPAEAGADCTDTVDDDVDTFTNDGCPAVAGYFYDPSGDTGAASATGAFCNSNRDSDLNLEAPDADETPIASDPANRDSDFDGSIDGVECQLTFNPASLASKPGTSLNPQQTTYYRLSGLTQPGGAALGAIGDGSTIGDVPETRGGGAGAGASMDTDRDGCPDETELADVDGNGSVGTSDRLGIARAQLGVSTFAPPGSAQADVEERRTADLDKNGTIGTPDTLGAARIALTASLAAIPDYNLSCSAGTIGYAAN